jgi:hypothetical protein
MQVLALVGDQLDYGDNICGAVLSIRFNEDIVSVWNRNASDHQVGIFTDPIRVCVIYLYSCLSLITFLVFHAGCNGFERFD